MRAVPLLTLVVVLAACGDPYGLRDASEENAVDSLVSLWAVSGTPLERHSAYAITLPQFGGAYPVRTDRQSGLDFAFDIDTAGRALLLPTGALDLGVGSGVLLSDQEFDSIKVAPRGGYEDSVGVAVEVGDVAVIRSRQVTCPYPPIPAFLYAKVHVLAVDLADRRIDFAILANINCGYTSLEPGLPSR